MRSFRRTNLVTRGRACGTHRQDFPQLHQRWCRSRHTWPPQCPVPCLGERHHASQHQRHEPHRFQLRVGCNRRGACHRRQRTGDADCCFNAGRSGSSLPCTPTCQAPGAECHHVLRCIVPGSRSTLEHIDPPYNVRLHPRYRDMYSPACSYGDQERPCRQRRVRHPDRTSFPAAGLRDGGRYRFDFR